jgi:hypothetical protein
VGSVEVGGLRRSWVGFVELCSSCLGSVGVGWGGPLGVLWAGLCRS